MTEIEKEFLSKFLNNEEDIKNILDKDDNKKLIPGNTLNINLNKSKETNDKSKNLSSISEKQNVHNFSVLNVNENKDSSIHNFGRKMSQKTIKSNTIILNQEVIPFLM